MKKKEFLVILSSVVVFNPPKKLKEIKKQKPLLQTSKLRKLAGVFIYPVLMSLNLNYSFVIQTTILKDQAEISCAGCQFQEYRSVHNFLILNDRK